MSTLRKINSSGLPVSWRWRAPINVRDEVDCDYLPSFSSAIPCFYKPVTCDPSPNVTNARMINITETSGSYLAKSQVKYECLDETFQMEGNSTVTCVYSGLWSGTPTCSSVGAGSSLLFVLLTLAVPFCLILYLFYRYRKRTNACIKT